MKTGLPNLLGAAIRDYFTDHLPRLRGTSPRTIHSYRDSMVLLLRFLSRQRNKPITGLDLTDLDPPGILAFLSHVEQERNLRMASPREMSASPLSTRFFILWRRVIRSIWSWPNASWAFPLSARDNGPSITWNTRRLTRFSKRSTGPPCKAAVTVITTLSIDTCFKPW